MKFRIKIYNYNYYFWRLEGVVRAEVDVQEEDASFIDGARRAKNGRDPFVEVIALGPSRAVGRRVECDFG